MHYNIDQKDEETLDDRRRDGGSNFILGIKEQETRLTLHERDDDDDDDEGPIPVAARLLRLLVLIPPGAWMSVCCECCVWSGRGPFVGLITRPEESYRL